ncbi:branched-chain amino acid ABC transporter permease [Acuticoccus sediminis]|uniref:Branched-chain amino acid ABC transporter permease n=1 Tax=Acuticoccus sediminis TaxID=2184697 RepID=A0A8B2NMW1_9HYPH|nr:branched-chain amino acid ABC transporter permease [Acuticoccus sediminis]RAH96813.1 branched-chain amino acid ABC transporter permease [Acuticoccus sediminis]
MTAYLIAIGSIGLIYALLALGLNLQWGQTGLINFGHVAFFAIGAYTSGLLALAGWPLPVTILVAMIVAGLAAWPLGRLTLTLKSDYLAVTAIGFSEVVRSVLENEAWLSGGPSGLPGIPTLFSGLSGLDRSLATFAVLLAVTVAVFLVLQTLTRSPFGRALRSIRDDEMAATALGKNVVSFKTRSLTLGAAIAGLAGAFYAHYLTFISPEQFTPEVTFNVWIAVIIGGSGSNPGVLLGTLILIIFLEGTRFLGDLGLALDGSQLGALRFMIIGAALVLCMIYRPSGILPPASRR